MPTATLDWSKCHAVESVPDRRSGAVDPAMANHLKFTQDAVRLRCSQPALRGEGLKPK